jgi:hypothetical protein
VSEFLRTRYSALHDRFGTAGVVLGVIAMILALGGSAFAASGGLSGKQKKEVKAIAKSFAGKDGTPGAAGTNGTNGKDGTNGSNGAPGANGVSVTGKAITGGACGSGVTGVEYTSATGSNAVCSGKPGKDGETGFTETLPPGETETGAWAFGDLTAGSAAPFAFYRIPISFTIKLGNAIPEANVHYINAAGKEIEDLAGTASAATSTVCTGTAAAPTAAAGHLCIYEGGLEHGFIGRRIAAPQSHTHPGLITVRGGTQRLDTHSLTRQSTVECQHSIHIKAPTPRGRNTPNDLLRSLAARL